MLVSIFFVLVKRVEFVNLRINVHMLNFYVKTFQIFFLLMSIQMVFNAHNTNPTDQIVESDWNEIHELTKSLKRFYYAIK